MSLIQELTVLNLKKENAILREKQEKIEKKMSAMEITMEEIKRENASLREKQVKIENERLERMKLVLGYHLVVDPIKRVLAQADCDIKKILAGTATSDTDGDGGNAEQKDAQQSSPSQPPPLPPRHAMSKEEIQQIEKQSDFYVWRTSPSFRIPRGPKTTPIEGYNETERHSPYIDRKTGIYTVPLKGKCWFSVGDEKVENKGKLEWFLCGEGGKKQEFTSHEMYVAGMHDPIVWECEKGDRVWLEARGVDRDVVVNHAEFEGSTGDEWW